MDIWAMIQQYVDPLTVFVVLLVTEIVRRFVPGATEAGKPMNRALPFVPLVLGVVVLGIQTTPFYPLSWAVKGLVSGAFASYVYRAFKVVILGD